MFSDGLRLGSEAHPRHPGTTVSMSRRLSATLYRLCKRIFKSLMTLNSGFKYHLRLNMFFYIGYINMLIYIHKALLLSTSMNPLRIAR